MVRITLKNNVYPAGKSVIANEADTLAAVLNANEFAYKGFQVNMDGRQITADQVELPLSQLGVQMGTKVTIITKMDNAFVR